MTTVFLILTCALTALGLGLAAIALTPVSAIVVSVVMMAVAFFVVTRLSRE